MNPTQLTILPVLISAVFVCGCDLVSGGKVGAERNASEHEAAVLNQEIETLKDQNSQLTKMLEESERKVAEISSTLEQNEKQLQESRAANAALEAQLAETNNRLRELGELASQIQASWRANTVSLEEQIKSLAEMLPQTSAAQQAADHPKAEQTAENSDDQSKNK